MPPFRNPFGKKPQPNGASSPNENTPPSKPNATNGERPGYPSSRASSTLSIRKKEEPAEYKLSVVNDSGVYLPPSPPEKKGFWQRSPTSSTMSSNHRSLLNENEPFSISRESFDSYRRSFDISARSPVPPAPTTPRQSLDSRMARPPRSSIKNLERPQPTDEEDFEDIGLNDDAKHQPPKKRSLFARFGDNSEASSSASGDNPRPTSSHKGFHFPGRKRGQSGQGAELGNIERPSAPTATNDNDDSTIR